jgi:WD40 repeat protein
LTSGTFPTGGRPCSLSAATLACALILTSLLLLLALVQLRRANRLLLAGNLLADARELSAAEPETATLLALESYRLAPTVHSLDQLQALLNALSERPAMRVDGEIGDLQITPDGRSLLTIAGDDTFSAWDLESGLRTGKGRLDQDALEDGTRLWSIQQSAGGSFIVLQAGNRYREWRAFGGPASRMLRLTGGLPALPDLDDRQIWFSPQGDWMLAMEEGMGSWFPRIEVRHLTGGGFSPQYSIAGSAGSAPCFSPDAARFAVDTPEGVQVVDLHTGRPAALGHNGGEVTRFAFSPAGPVLAAVDRDAGYQLWNYRTARIVHRVRRQNGNPLTAWVYGASFSARGRYLALAAWPVSYVFEAASGRLAARFQTNDSDACPSSEEAPPQLSTDERYAAGCDAGQVVVVDLRTGRRSATPRQEVAAFHLAPPYLAVASGHHVTVVQIDGMTPLARIDHGDTVSGVLFDPGQKQLIVWGGATIRRERWWGGAAAEACRKVKRNLTPQEWHTHLADLPYHKTCPNLP